MTRAEHVGLEHFSGFIARGLGTEFADAVTRIAHKRVDAAQRLDGHTNKSLAVVGDRHVALQTQMRFTEFERELFKLFKPPRRQDKPGSAGVELTRQFRANTRRGTSDDDDAVFYASRHGRDCGCKIVQCRTGLS